MVGTCGKSMKPSWGEEEGFRPGWKDADRTETWGLGGYRPVLLSQTYLGSYLSSALISPLTSDK